MTDESIWGQYYFTTTTLKALWLCCVLYQCRIVYCSAIFEGHPELSESRNRAQILEKCSLLRNRNGLENEKCANHARMRTTFRPILWHIEWMTLESNTSTTHTSECIPSRNSTSSKNTSGGSQCKMWIQRGVFITMRVCALSQTETQYRSINIIFILWTETTVLRWDVLLPAITNVWLSARNRLSHAKHMRTSLILTYFVWILLAANHRDVGHSGMRNLKEYDAYRRNSIDPITRVNRV